MAIIIPSKNIYNINNSKIVDNTIDNVSVGKTIINSNDKYNAPVYVKKYTSPSFKYGFEDEDWTESATVNVDLGSDARIHYAGVAVGIRPCYAKDINVWIDRIIDNAYISRILLDKTEYGADKINYSVVYKKHIGEARITVTQYPMGGNNTDYVKNIELTYYEGFEEQTQGTPPELKFEHTIEYSNANSDNIIATANVSATDRTLTANIDTIQYIDNTSINCVIKELLCGVERYSASQTGNMAQSNWGGDETTTRDLILEGECEKYEAIELQITFNGDTIGIDLTDGTVTIGEGNKPYSLSGNELLQDGGKVGEVSLAEHLANNVLQQYANGKETATILCSIDEYYDTNGDLVISTKTSDKMTFEHYDRVIPMVRNAHGKDVPLSCDEYGMVKVFEVVGVKVYFDGAVWQELTLCETGDKEYVYITEKPYLTFSSKSEFSLRTENSLKNWDGTLQYSTDTKKWNVWDGTTTIASLNGKLYLRGIGNTFITGKARQGFRFEGTDIECQGNIETLLDYTIVKEKKHPPMAPYCFSTLFGSENALIIPPSLPAIELSQYCYHQMFIYCDNLVALPRLPATKLASGCYTYMFSGCGKIQINLTPNAEDVKYRIPVGGNITQDASFDLTFKNTGGTFTGTPSINTDYYTPNELV